MKIVYHYTLIAGGTKLYLVFLTEKEDYTNELLEEIKNIIKEESGIEAPGFNDDMLKKQYLLNFESLDRLDDKEMFVATFADGYTMKMPFLTTKIFNL